MQQHNTALVRDETAQGHISSKHSFLSGAQHRSPNHSLTTVDGQPLLGHRSPATSQPKKMAWIDSHELQAQLRLNLHPSSSLQETLCFYGALLPEENKHIQPRAMHDPHMAPLIDYCKSMTSLWQSSQALRKAQGHTTSMLNPSHAPESVHWNQREKEWRDQKSKILLSPPLTASGSKMQIHTPVSIPSSPVSLSSSTAAVPLELSAEPRQEISGTQSRRLAVQILEDDRAMLFMATWLCS